MSWCKCPGVPRVNPLGWPLISALLRTLLEPIENDLCLSPEWWDLVEKVFCELLATYQGRPDKEWWSHIISYQKRFGSGAHGYRGWITDFLEEIIDIDERTASLVSVPLILEDPVRCEKDNSTLVTGMLGFNGWNQRVERAAIPRLVSSAFWGLVISQFSYMRLINW